MFGQSYLNLVEFGHPHLDLNLFFCKLIWIWLVLHPHLDLNLFWVTSFGFGWLGNLINTVVANIPIEKIKPWISPGLLWFYRVKSPPMVA